MVADMPRRNPVVVLAETIAVYTMDPSVRLVARDLVLCERVMQYATESEGEAASLVLLRLLVASGETAAAQGDREYANGGDAYREFVERIRFYIDN